MRLNIQPTVIKENVLDKPARFPVDRLIGPTTEYVKCRDREPEHPMTIDEHARWLVDSMEEEMVHEYHLDHVVDEDARSPYMGRSRGFKLKRESVCKVARGGPETNNKIIKSYLLNSQRAEKLLTLITRHNNEETELGNEIDKAFKKFVFNINLGGIGSIDANPTHMRLIMWAKSHTGYSEQQTDNIPSLQEIVHEYKRLYDEACNEHRNLRAKAYRKFMTKAVSHKSGQMLHRILKVRTDIISRPVSASASTTTADQAHADEQIT